MMGMAPLEFLRMGTPPTTKGKAERLGPIILKLSRRLCTRSGGFPDTTGGDAHAHLKEEKGSSLFSFGKEE
jgi:hypothetical protein